MLVGESYPLNPLEGFILGGAILLHDAALCFEAYEGGLTKIRETVEWKDSFAAVSDRTNNESARKHSADFQAIRLLHAGQASQLCSRSWKSNDAPEHFLISDEHLRTNVGELIGQIAASHHWSIEEVQSQLPRFVNSPSEFPSEWTVCPQKIACILRCADAMHIDGRRAPDFLYALLNRSGVSLSHWKAQNWIGRPSIDPVDPGHLLITSTRSFAESDFEAWWVAYDAARLIDREIRASNSLLSELDVPEAPPFDCKGVSGVDSPRLMSTYLRVSGWQPCNAELHVGNVEGLVRQLGGEQLYGNTDQLWVVLRELIQNARDAIAARQVLQSDYVGSVTVRVKSCGHYELEVEDDGLGMSERVLTSVLLDFGSSFWSTELVRSEFPGLRASKYKPVGRFGIGFYSAFMVAESVSVISRRWDCGLDDCRELKFKNQLSLRPLMCTGKVPGFTSSTRVTLQLKDDVIPQGLSFKVRTPRMGAQEFFVPLGAMLQRLVAGLDVQVYLEQGDGAKLLLHPGTPAKDVHDWLKKISFSEFLNGDESADKVRGHIQRMRPITVGDEQIGLAALSLMHADRGFLSLFTVGGLAVNPSASGQDSFIGYIDCPPLTAKRNQVALKDHPNFQEISNWAEEQLGLIRSQGLDPIDACFLPHALAEFGVDPRPDGMILLALDDGKQVIVKITEIQSILSAKPLAFLTSDLPNHVDPNNHVRSVSGHALYLPVKNSSFNSLKFEGSVPANENSLAYFLHDTLVAAGIEPKWGTIEGVGQNIFGMQLNARTLSI
ncbi:ATP-binding protein [Spongiibacter sp.]|uniref:HD domain-containing protein n=1 Tax=Spongiibacter sp. TaxID=2024860 RepID=UPI00257CD810|nr:ATP-binding protein [Spongiibacter sp.]